MGLKVNIEGLRFRAGDGVLNRADQLRRLRTADQLRLLGQRLSNPTATRLRADDNPVDLAQMLAWRQPLELRISEVDPLAGLAISGTIAVPEVIDVPGLNIKVATSVVTGGQMAGLVETGYYEGEDYLKAEFTGLINDPANADKGIGWVSKLDGEALAKEINSQNPGRNFRLPAEYELEEIFKTLGDQISGLSVFWIWTRTKLRPVGNPDSDVFALRRQGEVRRLGRYPFTRFISIAVLLVEDKK